MTDPRRQARAQLERHALAPARSRGQNFLVDPRWAERIVGFAELSPADAVIEIGPGLGSLTEVLARCARRVVAIEIDAGLVGALRERRLPECVELLHRDALEVDLATLAEGLGPRVVLVGNLPYALSAPLLRHILSARNQLRAWVVMLQSEVAHRIVAGSGSRDYGSLAVLHQLVTSVERRAELGPEHFYPAPKVSSAVVRVEPRPDAPVSGTEFDRLEVFLRAAFASRRKTLANSLAGRTALARERVVAALQRQGRDPRIRAEQLEPAALLDLFRALGDGAA